MRADAEWLETDGLGGFASGPGSGPRTRRYHALLVTSRNPPGTTRSTSSVVRVTEGSMRTKSAMEAANPEYPKVCDSMKTA